MATEMTILTNQPGTIQQLFWVRVLILLASLTACSTSVAQSSATRPWVHVSENQRYLVENDKKPFFWLGDTSWGMSEWLDRENVDYLLDRRAEQGFNVVQVCLFWGKRKENPFSFTANAPNAYGHKAFSTNNGQIDVTKPLVREGGTPTNPNDYWDHVDYILQKAESHGMLIAILPVWGRRYVNATHKGFSQPLFSQDAMHDYGEFLGKRYRNQHNIIWVLGGDIQADLGGAYLGHYRAMAEGIALGLTGQAVGWNEKSSVWDAALMTFHPDGQPLRNSSEWFHNDAWLDVNMIETYQNLGQVYPAVEQDYQLTNPVKPVVMGEPAYEGVTKQIKVTALQIRQQAYQTIFAGGAGFTYGAAAGDSGQGPLFSPTGDWQECLEWEGALSMKHLKKFCLQFKWWQWTPRPHAITKPGKGQLRQVAASGPTPSDYFLYTPEIRTIQLNSVFAANESLQVLWFDTKTGDFNEPIIQKASAGGSISLSPPSTWSDAVAIVAADPNSHGGEQN